MAHKRIFRVKTEFIEFDLACESRDEAREHADEMGFYGAEITLRDLVYYKPEAPKTSAERDARLQDLRSQIDALEALYFRESVAEELARLEPRRGLGQPNESAEKLDHLLGWLLRAVTGNERGSVFFDKAIQAAVLHRRACAWSSDLNTVRADEIYLAVYSKFGPQTVSGAALLTGGDAICWILWSDFIAPMPAAAKQTPFIAGQS